MRPPASRPPGRSRRASESLYGPQERRAAARRYAVAGRCCGGGGHRSESRGRAAASPPGRFAPRFRLHTGPNAPEEPGIPGREAVSTLTRCHGTAQPALIPLSVLRGLCSLVRREFVQTLDRSAHAHPPGIDDGSRTLERRARDGAGGSRRRDAGRCRDAARPRGLPDGARRAWSARVAELRPRWPKRGSRSTCSPAARSTLDRLDLLSEDELAGFGLGGNPDYLLVESPYNGWPLALPEQVSALRDRGVIPVLAHPERNAEVQGDPERLRPLVLMGALCQVTAVVARRPHRPAVPPRRPHARRDGSRSPRGERRPYARRSRHRHERAARRRRRRATRALADLRRACGDRRRPELPPRPPARRAGASFGAREPARAAIPPYEGCGGSTTAVRWDHRFGWGPTRERDAAPMRRVPDFERARPTRGGVAAGHAGRRTRGAGDDLHDQVLRWGARLAALADRFRGDEDREPAVPRHKTCVPPRFES